MSTQSPPPPSRGLQILKVVFYILSGIILLVGLIAGASLLLGAGAVIENVRMTTMLLGGGAVTNLVVPLLSAFLINFGIATLIVAILLSAFLYAFGFLIGHVARLEARLTSLEQNR